MRKCLLYIIIFFIGLLSLKAQNSNNEPIDDHFDELTNLWIEKSSYLKTYEGVNDYCRKPSFRHSVDSVLIAIHSYDSLIISKLSGPTQYIDWHSKKEEKTLEEIETLEHTYGLDAFVSHMRKTCEFRNEIEANASRLKNGVGYESYDSKILLIETEMTSFLRKIDRLMIKVDQHLHQIPLVD